MQNQDYRFSRYTLISAIVVFVLTVGFFSINQVNYQKKKKESLVEGIVKNYLKKKDLIKKEKPKFYKLIKTQKKILLPIVFFTLFMVWYNYMVREEYNYKYNGFTFIFLMSSIFIQCSINAHWGIVLSYILIVLILIGVELASYSLFNLIFVKPLRILFSKSEKDNGEKS